MKKYLFLFFILAVCGSCSDDDTKKVIEPVLNKLTKATCTKNGEPFFTADITYTREGKLDRILTDQYTDLFTYTGNTLVVAGTKNNLASSALFTHTIYTLSGNTIVQKTERAENPYASSEVYDSSISTYRYSGAYLSVVSQTVRWPKANGGGYEERNLGEIDKFVWERGNVAYYDYIPRQEMAYEYGSHLRPSNFPFRVINTFRPVGFEIVSPVNSMFGGLNLNLPERAYWYNISSEMVICVEYAYTYTFTGDYISSMTITEKINPVNDAKEEQNTYKYTFEYNYKVK